MILNRLIAIALVGAACLVAGCGHMKPGDYARISPVSDAERAGNVYLVRGFIGIFSGGIDKLSGQVYGSGVRTTVFQLNQGQVVAEELIAQYNGADSPEPLVLIGHSYGADEVVSIARRLDEAGVPVDVLITIDPVTPGRVPGNVQHAYNLYQSSVLDRMPFLRGVPLRLENGQQATALHNMDLRSDRRDLLVPSMTHFNIEQNPRVHEEIVRLLHEHCPPREQWAARGMQRPLPAAPSTAQPAGTSGAAARDEVREPIP